MIRIMGNRKNISDLFLHTGLTALWILMIAYFAFHAFQGNSGLGELKRLEKEIASISIIARDISEDRIRFESRIDTLSDGSIDPDMLEEKVREKLGFIHPDEVILFVGASKVN